MCNNKQWGMLDSTYQVWCQDARGFVSGCSGDLVQADTQSGTTPSPRSGCLSVCGLPVTRLDFLLHKQAKNKLTFHSQTKVFNFRYIHKTKNLTLTFKSSQFLSFNFHLLSDLSKSTITNLTIAIFILNVHVVFLCPGRVISYDVGMLP